MKALIVTDSKLIKAMLSDIFSNIEEMIPVYAESADEALKAAQIYRYDFICSSAYLEDCDGVEFIKTVRSKKAYRYTPIILLTSNYSQAFHVSALANGATEVFHKNKFNQLVNFLTRLAVQKRAIDGRILYIEDSPTQREIIKQILTSKGLEVDDHSSADLAWDAFQEQDYDLILTDVILENSMTGMEFVNKIRRMDGEKGDIPIIALTGFDDISRRLDLLSLGANDYIVKPAIEEELISKIRIHIDKQRLLLEAKQESLRAEEALKVKSEFLANMSHEIRTPMNAIIGMTHLALTHELNDKQKDRIQKAHGAAENLLGILNDILDFSKIESGKIKLETVNFHLKEVLNNYSTIIGVKAAENNINVSIDIGSDVPRILYGDPLRLGQILINLGSNAVKFSPDNSRIKLSISVESETDETILLKFSLHDQGIGISEEQQQKLFDTFSQADSSTSRQYGGTGLGLSICKSLTQQMSGKIWLESDFNQGSTFHFTILLEKVKEQSEKDLNLNKPYNDFEAQKACEQLKSKKILLVEDNELNQELILELLLAQQVTVLTAWNGQEAIELLQAQSFDAVIMDCMMPVMDGYEATRQIRQQEQHKNLPIIALTANAMADDKQKAIDAGMNAHIAKPLIPNVLFITLAKWLQGPQ